MPNAAIVSLEFDNQTWQLQLRLWGHPTHSLKLALETSQLVLGSKPWRVVGISGSLDEDERPSDFVMDVTAKGY